ncbi:MAG: hypothetical protein EBX37_17605 [Alphaproteobacteria bacterium]|nr:hypothetical protein [Alphaproteobacteria bacterium]
MKTIHFQPFALFNSRMPKPTSTLEKAATPNCSVGRPTAYRPEICEQLIEVMAIGLSAEAAAANGLLPVWWTPR